MNINSDVKKSNNDMNVQNSKLLGINSRNAKNASNSEFSYYVEVSNSCEVKEEI